MKNSNRKLRRGVAFEGPCYMQYQKPIIEWYMEKNGCSDMDAMAWYVQSGLAEKFEQHHRVSNQTITIVSELGQKIS